MKILKHALIAASLIAGALGSAAPAEAQRVVETRTTTVHRDVRYRPHRRRVCTVHRYRHQRVRRCYWR